MSKQDAATDDPGQPSTLTRDEQADDRAGNAPAPGASPSRAGRERDEAADDGASPVDLEAVRERAS
jgi:hypothetical protein